MPRPGKAFNVYLSDEERQALDRLAETTGRSVHDEIKHAIRRHLAVPPRPVQTDPLPEAPADPLPKKKPGRKPKGEKP